MNEQTTYEQRGRTLQRNIDIKRAKRFKDLNSRCDAGNVVCKKCLGFYGKEPKARSRYGTCFAPECTLSTGQRIHAAESSSWWAGLSNEEKNDFRIGTDPITWAAARLRSSRDFSKHWEPEWYQVEPLQCTARKRLLLFGRQIGKTEVLCVSILNRMDTRENYKILVICPYQTQVNNIYQRLEKLIDNSPALKIRQKRRRENPVHEIEFKNGSYVRMFTAGVQTGKAGADVRGQSADLLVLDEADYLDDETLTTIMATLVRASNPELLVSSTPTGRRATFYEWATDPSQSFRTFHYPSMVAPEWDEEKELFLRRNYSAAYFAHEYLAEFGSMEAGVFRHQDLDADGVIQDYDILDPVPLAHEMYIMGVDWNMRGTGGVLLILGYNRKTEMFRVAYKEIIDPEEFTQLNTVRRIVQLNRIWNPSHIYVDYGHGDPQVELLTKYGRDHPKTKLHRRVRGILMQGTVEIADPMTGKKVKKQAKNLMVEMAVGRVECGQCVFPKSEDHKEGLVGQMRDYQVEYVGRGGNKVFSGGNEHLLTAWMLALFGFMMEFSDLAKLPSISETIMLDSSGKAYTRKAIEEYKDSVRAMRERLQPSCKTQGPQPKLTPMESIKHASRGLPSGFNPNKVLRPLGRKRW